MDNPKLCVSKYNEIDSLVNIVKIVSRDIGMQFEFVKYAALKMKRGKQVHFQGIDLGDGAVIEQLDEEGYKYLGILEGMIFCQQKMKEKVQKEKMS